MLTPAAVKAARTRASAYMLADGRALHLCVTFAGLKSFRLRFGWQDTEDQIDLSRIDAKLNQFVKQHLVLVPAYNGKSGIVTVLHDIENDRTLILIYTANDDRQPDGMIIALGDHTDFVGFVF